MVANEGGREVTRRMYQKFSVRALSGQRRDPDLVIAGLQLLSQKRADICPCRFHAGCIKTPPGGGKGGFAHCRDRASHWYAHDGINITTYFIYFFKKDGGFRAGNNGLISFGIPAGKIFR
jgi:hypothetical protein